MKVILSTLVLVSFTAFAGPTNTATPTNTGATPTETTPASTTNPHMGKMGGAGEKAATTTPAGKKEAKMKCEGKMGAEKEKCEKAQSAKH